MQALDPLILDLVEWVAAAPRSYSDVIDAWRTSCPRLTVWEEATEQRYVVRDGRNWREARVLVTEEGRRFLQQNGRL